MAQNKKIARKLCDITNDFYRKQATSFSETRRAPWFGWQQCLDIVRQTYADTCEHFSIFDLACGNLRFEKFVTAKFPDTPLTFYAVDNCDLLVRTAFDTNAQTICKPTMNYQNLDIMQALFEHGTLADELSVPLCDLSVSFGFMHHIPLTTQRTQLLTELIDHTRPQGIIAVSFWRFLSSPDLAKRARVSHEKACKELGLPSLDEGDYLLGWKNIPSRYRYCHSFSDNEITELISSVSDRADILARFSADGRTGNLNEYLMLRVL